MAREAQKERWLPKIASGEMRLQAFGVTEPTSGTDTTRIQTFAKRVGDKYVVNGSKIWISRAEHSDLMVLLCRTIPRDDAGKTSDGMSVLLVDMREAKGKGLTIKPVRTMLNHATTELFFDNHGSAGGEPDRPGGRGVQVHSRRHECGAHPDRVGMHRRRAVLR